MPASHTRHTANMTQTIRHQLVDDILIIFLSWLTATLIRAIVLALEIAPTFSVGPRLLVQAIHVRLATLSARPTVLVRQIYCGSLHQTIITCTITTFQVAIHISRTFSSVQAETSRIQRQALS